MIFLFVCFIYSLSLFQIQLECKVDPLFGTSLATRVPPELGDRQVSVLPLIICTRHHVVITQRNLMNAAIDLTIKCKISRVDDGAIHQTGLTYN